MSTETGCPYCGSPNRAPFTNDFTCLTYKDSDTDHCVQSVLCVERAKVRALRIGVDSIAKFGTKNTGRGYTCAQMAIKLLNETLP